VSAVIVKTLWMYGLAIVVSLAIAVVIKLIVVVLNALERKPAAARAATAPPPVPTFDVGADHVAAISAAVYVMIGSHRIVHIEDTRRGGEWVVEGRLAHHGSHSAARRPNR
jgi:hypothetical protein